ncbi:Phosphate-import protein PhnD precursor [Pirellulimonas nuda]|uniref:Phosphate-import protein PhnD n=1 Tax=Pirellulimonas nuda TaxID=2528009 RepID=A0A518DB94_9BACT|nr:phosphate/phosphite/phosphonate ABC transporter substrate-binding protein [Pirellulimonas nuda]QDU88747.1 Phosphate-import protein PhnD precursor [Pirellulimonas nuda]
MQNPELRPSLSWGRVFLVAAPLAVIASAITFIWTSSVQDDARSALERNVLSKMLLQAVEPAGSGLVMADSDGDLVADTPPEPDSLQHPDKLVFAYIAEEQEESPSGQNWQELTEAISKAVGKPVEFASFTKVNEQLEALRIGQVHIIGLSTGAAPLAVDSAGFVPLATLAQQSGDVGYEMQIMVPADSPIKETADLRGKRVVFVRPTSNSGFKAAFVYLYKREGLLPEQDYQWSFSLSHKDSIRALLKGGADAAPVASDLLAEMIESGEVPPGALRSIYDSERFPPAVIGCAHDLPADEVASIRNALTGFNWDGTGVQRELGPTGAARFVEVNYKNDWANIRRIDEAVREVLSGDGN